MGIQLPPPLFPEPYEGGLYGMGSAAHFAARGPGVHVVCPNSEKAKEVAAALNAAFHFGILHERVKQ